MMQFRLGSVRALLAVAVWIGSFVAAAQANAAAWTLDPAKSTLGFSGVQTDARFQGRFKRFNAAISLDPDHLETAHISVTVDLASALTNDSQRDSALPDKDWFDVAQFPQARFESTAIHHKGGNVYEAVGALTLRGVKRPLTLPFTLQINGAVAHAVGRTQLMRNAFGVGQGPWATGQWVALPVDLIFDVTATRGR